MFKFENRLRKLETAMDKSRRDPIGQLHVLLARVGLVTAGVMLSPAEFQQLVEAFQRPVPKVEPEEKADTREKQRKAMLKSFAQTVDLFVELDPKVRGVMVKKLQNLQVDVLDKEMLEEFVIPYLAGVPEEDIFSALEQGTHSQQGPNDCSCPGRERDPDLHIFGTPDL